MDNLSVLKYFSGAVYKALCAMKGDVNEIRLRSGKPLAVTVSDSYRFLAENGAFTEHPENALTVGSEDIRRCFEAICRYSVHSCQNQINRGFVTVAGGHRAGICGTAVYSADGRIDNIKNIIGINFRIAREITGAADEIMNRIMPGGLRSVLICGEPCSGKTTVLRDMCRRIGDRYPVSLIDERGEIAAVCGGEAYNNVGCGTDVFSGYTKPDGIITAVRSMSPRMIFCDEIGSEADCKAIALAAASGVKTAATIHCSDMTELLANPNGEYLIKSRLIEYAVFMHKGRVRTILDMSELSDEIGGVHTA